MGALRSEGPSGTNTVNRKKKSISATSVGNEKLNK